MGNCQADEERPPLDVNPTVPSPTPQQSSVGYGVSVGPSPTTVGDQSVELQRSGSGYAEFALSSPVAGTVAPPPGLEIFAHEQLQLCRDVLKVSSTPSEQHRVLAIRIVNKKTPFIFLCGRCSELHRFVPLPQLKQLMWRRGPRRGVSILFRFHASENEPDWLLRVLPKKGQMPPDVILDVLVQLRKRAGELDKWLGVEEKKELDDIAVVQKPRGWVCPVKKLQVMQDRNRQLR